MKAAWYEKNGTTRDVMIVGEQPTPQPAAGEVRVALHCSGVNPSDVKSRTAILDRGDMVSDNRRHHTTTLLTRAAHRVLTQESRTHRAPPR